MLIFHLASVFMVILSVEAFGETPRELVKIAVDPRHMVVTPRSLVNMPRIYFQNPKFRSRAVFVKEAPMPDCDFGCDDAGNDEVTTTRTRTKRRGSNIYSRDNKFIYSDGDTIRGIVVENSPSFWPANFNWWKGLLEGNEQDPVIFANLHRPRKDSYQIHDTIRVVL